MDSRMMANRPTERASPAIWTLVGPMLVLAVSVGPVWGQQESDKQPTSVATQQQQQQIRTQNDLSSPSTTFGQVNYGGRGPEGYSTLVSSPSDYSLAGLLAGYGGAVGAIGGAGQPGTKRARKMSAFMPMRGRKDGRDSGRWAWPEAGSAPVARHLLRSMLSSTSAPPGFSDSDGDSLGYFRLVSPTNGELTTSGWSASSGSPRRFVNQLASMTVAASRQQPTSGEIVQYEPATFGTGSGQTEEEQSADMMALGPVMQAKLRRAFHPMRGKKSLPVSLREALMVAAANEDLSGDGFGYDR